MAKRGKQSFSSKWRDFSLTLSALLVGWLTIYAWKLNRLLPGYSSNELSSINQSTSLHSIWANPIDAPYKILAYLGHLILHNQVGIRIAGLIWAAIFICSFYLIASRWFGKMVGALSTLVLATTPVFIIAARSATPMIMAASLLPVAAVMLAIPKSEKPERLFYLLAISAGISIYHPGLIWLLILLLILDRKAIMSAIKRLGLFSRFASVLTILASTAPLVYRFIVNPSFIKTFLALPQHWPNVIAILKNFIWGWLSLVWRAPYHVEWIIGRLSFFSVIEVALVVMGIFAMLRHARSKALAIVVFCGLGILVEAINGNLTFVVAVIPAILIFTAAGIRFLYYEWNSVFPFNPVPRSVANFAILAVLFVQILWGVRYALIAWPLSPATTHAYHAIIRQ